MLMFSRVNPRKPHSRSKRTHIAENKREAFKLRITMNLNKCKLQEMCQSRGWALPKYSGTQQGPPHQPYFSASVLVDGFTFSTKTMLRSKKEAEGCAAGLALDYLNENPQQPQPKRITMNLNKCKLQEMCHSRGWALPKYSGTQQGQPHQPYFSASVLVDGNTFSTKTMLSSKKEAEGCAAGLALDYLDENPQQPPPKRTKCFSLPAQPSHIASLPPPSSPGLLHLTYKENELWNETTSTEGIKDTYELPLVSPEQKKLWLSEKFQLQLKNIEELENQVDMKKNELEYCCKMLPHMVPHI